VVVVGRIGVELEVTGVNVFANRCGNHYSYSVRYGVGHLEKVQGEGPKLEPFVGLKLPELGEFFLFKLGGSLFMKPIVSFVAYKGGKSSFGKM